MAKDINLTSQEWCDIVFEGKNKAYGAYEMRQSSSKRHLIALLLVAVLAILIAVLPTLVATVAEAVRRQSDALTEETRIVAVDPLEEEIKKMEELRTEPPPPPLKPTMQFIAPEMADASEIDDDSRMINQEDLQKSKVQISIANVEGENVEGAIDIADLGEINKISEDDTQIYVGVEIQPQFPGGEVELMKYIKDNLRYPVVAIENNIEGRVTLRFVVNKKGEVSNVEILRGLDPACDKEAIRVVQSMPKWVPGKQNGVSVNVYYTLPISYKLQQQ